MEYKTLGRTGLRVSVMSFGAGAFGDMYGDTTQQNANDTVAMAIDAGINLFDVAPSYGPEGLAEQRLGIALQGKRQDVILNTKFGRWDHGIVGAPEYEYNFEPKRIREELEKSLKRLKTDYIDVYQAHDINNCRELDYLVEYTLPELEKLNKEGKIRHIGITGVYLDVLKYVLDHTDSVDTVLSFCRYNLIDTTLKGYFSEYIQNKGLGIINASILYMGMLTHNIKTLVHWREKALLNNVKEAVAKAVKRCEEAGTSLPEQAFLFGMAYDEPASTLIGMGRPSSLKRNLGLINKERNPELEKELAKLFKNISLFPNEGQKNGISIRGSYSDTKN